MSILPIKQTHDWFKTFICFWFKSISDFMQTHVMVFTYFLYPSRLHEVQVVTYWTSHSGVTYVHCRIHRKRWFLSRFERFNSWKRKRGWWSWNFLFPLINGNLIFTYPNLMFPSLQKLFFSTVLRHYLDCFHGWRTWISHLTFINLNVEPH